LYNFKDLKEIFHKWTSAKVTGNECMLVKTLAKLGDALELFVYFFLVRYRFFKEQQRIKKQFYRDASFQTCDRTLLSYYSFSNPYRIVKNHYLSLGEKQPHQYGETPLTSLEKIARECHLSEKDHLFELGCGRGRGVFFLAHALKCRVHGIEWIPQFVAIASAVKRRTSFSTVQFSCQNMLETNLSEATAIYLYGTCLEETFLAKLATSFLKLRPKCKIITVSYPLASYTDLKVFPVEKSFKVAFPWGIADVFLQSKV
jgi:hypothetical protein